MALVTLAVAGCSGSGDDEIAPVASAPTEPVATMAPRGEAGRVLAAGDNDRGQLGWRGGAISTALVPVGGAAGAAVLDSVKDVAAGANHSLAVTADGQVLAWGGNKAGQLGDGTTTDRPTPVLVRAPDGATGALDKVTAIWSDSDFSMALRSDGTLVTWGAGDAGQRGIGELPPPLYPTTVRSADGTQPLTGVVAASADGRTALALTGEGVALAWGNNDDGQLGIGSLESRNLPTPVAGLAGKEALDQVVEISVGGQHGIARLVDGRVVAWGSNVDGQLGDGTRDNRLRPGPVVGVDGIGSLRDVVQVSAAERYNLALRSDGTVVGWGANGGGQLGDGTHQGRAVPAVVLESNRQPLRNVREIRAGEAYAVAILTDGSLRTWGANGRGQLGQGRPTEAIEYPARVATAAGARLGRVLNAGVGEKHLLVVTAS